MGPILYDHGIIIVTDATNVLCIDPRVEPSTSGTVNGGEHIGQYGVPAAYERSFKWKVGYFRNLCAVSQRESMLDIPVMIMITTNAGQ